MVVSERLGHRVGNAGCRMLDPTKDSRDLPKRDWRHTLCCFAIYMQASRWRTSCLNLALHLCQTSSQIIVILSRVTLDTDSKVTCDWGAVHCSWQT